MVSTKVNMETIRLIRDGEKGWGKGVRRWGKREIIYLFSGTLSQPE